MLTLRHTVFSGLVGFLISSSLLADKEEQAGPNLQIGGAQAFVKTLLNAGVPHVYPKRLPGEGSLELYRVECRIKKKMFKAKVPECVISLDNQNITVLGEDAAYLRSTIRWVEERLHPDTTEKGSKSAAIKCNWDIDEEGIIKDCNCNLRVPSPY